MIDCSMYTIDYNEVNNDIIQVDNIIEGNLIQWKKYFMNLWLIIVWEPWNFGHVTYTHPPAWKYSIV